MPREVGSAVRRSCGQPHLSQNTFLYPRLSGSYRESTVKAVQAFLVPCHRHGYWGTRKPLQAPVRQSRTVGAGQEPGSLSLFWPHLRGPVLEGCLGMAQGTALLTPLVPISIF